MAGSNEAEIRRRAHQIWEEEGRPEGKESDHWLRAARELEGSEGDRSGAMKQAAEGSKSEQVADGLQHSGKGKSAAR